MVRRTTFYCWDSTDMPSTFWVFPHTTWNVRLRISSAFSNMPLVWSSFWLRTLLFRQRPIKIMKLVSNLVNLTNRKLIDLDHVFVPGNDLSKSVFLGNYNVANLFICFKVYFWSHKSLSLWMRIHKDADLHRKTARLRDAMQYKNFWVSLQPLKCTLEQLTDCKQGY
jgi:hypothetical protein